MSTKLIQLTLFMFIVTGCTTKDFYEITQDKLKSDCRNKVSIEREQCYEQINTKSYKEYEAERQAIIKGK